MSPRSFGRSSVPARSRWERQRPVGCAVYHCGAAHFAYETLWENMPMNVLAANDILYFLHIPKTAGTTLNSLLDRQFRLEEICPFTYKRLERRIEETGGADLSGYRLLRSHYDYSIYRILGRKPRYLTMLRHPVDRLRSVYDHIVHQPGHDLHEEVTRQGWTLSDFVRLTKGSSRFHNRQTYQLAGAIQGFGTEVPRNAPEDEILRRGLDHLEECAYVGLTERFDASLHLLTATFGWDDVGSYEALNVSPRVRESTIVPEDVAAAIEDLNRLDMRLYDEGVALFERRRAAMNEER